MSLESIWISVKDYLVLIIVALVVFGYILFKERVKRRKKKASSEVVVENNKQVVEQQPAVEETEVVEAKPKPIVVEESAFDFSGLEDADDSSKQNIIDKLNYMSDGVNEELTVVEQQTIEHYDKVKEEYREVNNKRMKLLEEANNLKKLYNNYLIKERFLKATINNLEKVIEQKQGGDR